MRFLITYILINCEWFIIKLCGIGIILLTDLLCGIASYYFSIDLRFDCIFNISCFDFQITNLTFSSITLVQRMRRWRWAREEGNLKTEYQIKSHYSDLCHALRLTYRDLDMSGISRSLKSYHENEKQIWPHVPMLLFCIIRLSLFRHITPQHHNIIFKVKAN